MSIVDELYGTLKPKEILPLHDADDHDLAGFVEVHVDPWQRRIRELARDGAITPRSSILMGRSLHHIVAHVTVTHDQGDSVDVGDLHARAGAETVSLPDFARHATRWALANSALVSPEATDTAIARLPGMKLRDNPLTETEVALYLEGWSAR
ncbi:hypothetical protein [Hyphomicrobium sp. DY-1]|uniref:hypothetical protein n=1 Tax=Hyphomicrobium sp. DY-1 TaxID=3075650 RepID=UPI0039C0B102